MSKVTLKVPNQAEPVVADCRLEGNRFAITLDAAVHEGSLTLTGPGEGWLHYADRILPFYMTRMRETLSIWLDGKTYHLELISAGGRKGGAGAGVGISDGEIKAPMPGTVLKVLVKAGDAVTVNQPLVIMESMKMEMTLAAPHEATVEEIRCEEGQLVDMGASLVILKSNSD